ncbi:MAG: hypothetical protein ACRENP_17115 [Longimicrobiales bacterium]
MIDDVASPPEFALRRFRAYPEYRDSGTDGLGYIPAGWDVRRLKTIASVRLSNVDKHAVEGQEPVRLCNYIDVYYNERITSSLQFMSASATPEQVRRFSLRPGDVLITKDSESWIDIAVPAVVTEELRDVLCGYHLALIRPDVSILDGRFLARAFAAVGIRDQFQVAANGITRFGLGGDAIQAGVFVVPPLDEQRAIAAFLDRETAKIDALVAKKERLIELLQEKRTVVITRAVTKGLDPAVPMKDSAVEWLGAVPAHWQLRPIWTLCDAVSGGTPSREERSFWDGDIPWVSPKDMKRTEIASAEESITERAVTETGLKLVSPPVVLIVVRGMILAHSFPVAVTTAQVTINQDMKALHCRTGVDPAFMASWFNGVAAGLLGSTVEDAAHGTRAIRMDRWRTLVVPLPLFPEQRAIAQYVSLELTKLDALARRVNSGIAYLNELRTALISAAVTGKIDVRSHSA